MTKPPFWKNRRAVALDISGTMRDKIPFMGRMGKSGLTML
jgi:hypothetical protein